VARGPNKSDPQAAVPAEDMVRSLARLLDETGLSEIEIEEAGRRVRVARAVNGPVHTVVAPAVTPLMPAMETHPPADPAAHPGVVLSPMVGSAYRAAAPGGKPFVDIGSRVKVGDTVLIIEAMKTLNQIPAPRAGTVAQILFEDGQPVEFGQPLMIVE
jgi:acetyl-CoA carboxylase biotin carboxyl carrier protein